MNKCPKIIEILKLNGHVSVYLLLTTTVLSLFAMVQSVDKCLSLTVYISIDFCMKNCLILLERPVWECYM